MRLDHVTWLRLREARGVLDELGAIHVILFGEDRRRRVHHHDGENERRPEVRAAVDFVYHRRMDKVESDAPGRTDPVSTEELHAGHAEPFVTVALEEHQELGSTGEPRDHLSSGAVDPGVIIVAHAAEVPLLLFSWTLTEPQIDPDLGAIGREGDHRSRDRSLTNREFGSWHFSLTFCRETIMF